MPLVLSGDGAVGPLSATEVGFLDGVTSSVQTQLNGKIASGAAGMTLIASGTLSGGSIVLGSIPGTYKDLRVIIRNYLPATDNIGTLWRVNGDSTANRYRVLTASVQSTFTLSSWNFGYGSDNAVTNSLQICELLDYANAATWKISKFTGVTNNSTTPTNFDFDTSFGVYNQTAAITSITVLPSSGNFTSGTYELYGVN